MLAPDLGQAGGACVGKERCKAAWPGPAPSRKQAKKLKRRRRRRASIRTLPRERDPPTPPPIVFTCSGSAHRGWARVLHHGQEGRDRGSGAVCAGGYRVSGATRAVVSLCAVLGCVSVLPEALGMRKGRGAEVVRSAHTVVRGPCLQRAAIAWSASPFSSWMT